jgi:hypothetical protein
VFRAWHHLKQLTDLGPRVHTSPVTEVHAVKLILDKLEEVKKISKHDVEISHQERILPTDMLKL